MMPNSFSLGTILFSFCACLALTPMVRALARHWGMVARLRADRWGKKPTALLGGTAIFIAVVLASLPLIHQVDHGWLILGASAFLYAIGLIDDLLNIKPYQKLIGQIMGACLIILGGLALPWTSSPLVNNVITLVWLVGITNAINLLDNMDGLAAGVAAIASIFLAANFYVGEQYAEALLLGIFAAALIGFLFYNFNPASIYMGDCGSMFVGFFLASAALSHVSGGRSRSLFSVLAVPVLLLLIPIFDTTLVTVLRKLAGRAASQGGRDHSSHRLVALGLSERRAVGLLYGLATLSGVLALCVRNLPADISLVLILGFTVCVTLLGIHLAGVRVYEENQKPAGNEQGVFTFLVNLSYKRRLFEVTLDVMLIGLAFYGANLLHYGSLGDDGAVELLTNSMPVLVFIKLAAFLSVGVYNGIWRYIGINDLWVYFKAVVVGSALSVLAFVLLFGSEDVSRSVLTLDALLLFLLLAGTRVAFRLLRSVFPLPRKSGARRVLIYGAGDAGELLLRAICNDAELNCVPIGFADDDAMKKGKVIHGLPVFGGNGSLPDICRKHEIDEVYISSTRFSQQRVKEILDQCKEIEVGLKRMLIQIETLQESRADLAA